MIDPVASDRVRRYGLPESLRVPIAAVDEMAIKRHVGAISESLFGAGKRRAFLIRAHAPLPVDLRLPIWEHPGADMLHQPLQVWVHRTYGLYRPAYQRAYPDAELDGLGLSHAMNRRLAAAKGFDFVRLTPTPRAANSSSAFAEGWAIDGTPSTSRSRGTAGELVRPVCRPHRPHSHAGHKAWRRRDGRSERRPEADQAASMAPLAGRHAKSGDGGWLRGSHLMRIAGTGREQWAGEAATSRQEQTFGRCQKGDLPAGRLKVRYRPVSDSRNVCYSCARGMVSSVSGSGRRRSARTRAG